MPIIQVHKLKYCCIYIWHIKESLGELIEIANRYNLDNFDNITHKGRLKQFIAARVTLAKGLNLDHIPKLTKTLSGKPIFKELSMFFSISHCGDLVAVAISQYEIGIDIQTISKKIHIIHDRFLSLKEKNILLRNSVNFNYLLYLRKLCLYWTAKEALFKLIDKQNISFKKNIQILRVNSKRKNIQINFIAKGSSKSFNLNYLFINNYYISYVLCKCKNS